MKRWEDRPEEVANLLNPAFCGHLIYSSVQAHQTENSKPMPYAVAFLVLPLALHATTREAILRAVIRHFEVWIDSNQEIKIGLGCRVRSLVPFARETLAFLLQTGALEIQESDAALLIGKRLRQMRGRLFPPSDETKACIKAAAVLGKWFARVNSPATIYASLGLVP
jgi:hypothetical protein